MMKRIFCVLTALIGTTIVWAQESDERLLVEYLDNGLIAVVKNGSTLEIIDSTTRKTAMTLPFSRAISALLVTNEGLFIGKTDGGIDRFRFTDRTTDHWKMARTYKMTDTSITAIAYDNGRLLAGDRRGKIATLNPNVVGDNLKVIGGHADAEIKKLAFSSGDLVSFANNGVKARIWSSYYRVTGYMGTDDDAALDLFVSGDKKRFAVYVVKNDSKNAEIQIFQGTRFEKTIPLPQDVPPVIGGAFSHDTDAKYLLLATMDGAVILNTKTGEVVTRHQGLGPSTVAYRPDDRQYVVWNGDRLRFFDAMERPAGTLKITSNTNAVVLINGKEPEDGGSVSAGTERYISVDVGNINISLKDNTGSKIFLNNKEIKNYRLTEGETIELLIKQPEAAAAKPILKTGRIVSIYEDAAVPRIIRSARDGSLIIADFGSHAAVIENDLKVKIILNPSGCTLTAFGIALDKKTLYLGYDNGLCRMVTGNEERQLNFEGAISAMEAGADLIAITAGSKIYTINPVTAQPIHAPIEFGAAISAAALYGERLAVGSINGDAAVINVKTAQREPRIFALRSQPVAALAWINDGKYAVVSYQDGLTLIHNSSSGVRALDPIRGPGPVLGLSVNLNDKRLAIIYETSIAQIDLNTGKTAETISLEAGSNGTAAYWLAENKLAVAGPNNITFYNGSVKKAVFCFYPDKGPGAWTFVTTPLYSSSSNYYAVSDEGVEDQVLEVRLDGNKTRPLAAEDRVYKNIDRIKGEL